MVGRRTLGSITNKVLIAKNGAGRIETNNNIFGFELVNGGKKHGEKTIDKVDRLTVTG